MQKVMEWYGWIPTNLGRLNFGYVEERVTLQLKWKRVILELIGKLPIVYLNKQHRANKQKLVRKLKLKDNYVRRNVNRIE